MPVPSYFSGDSVADWAPAMPSDCFARSQRTCRRPSVHHARPQAAVHYATGTRTSVPTEPRLAPLAGGSPRQAISEGVRLFPPGAGVPRSEPAALNPRPSRRHPDIPGSPQPMRARCYTGRAGCSGNAHETSSAPRLASVSRPSPSGTRSGRTGRRSRRTGRPASNRRRNGRTARV